MPTLSDYMAGVHQRWDEVPTMDHTEYSSTDDKVLDTLANTKALTRNMARIPINVLSAALNAPGVANPLGDPSWSLDQANERLAIPEMMTTPFTTQGTGTQIVHNASQPSTANKQLGAIMWQGSPHRGITKLSDEAIGTGEGNAAFTRGHYMAQNPKVAETYVGDVESTHHLTKDDVRAGGMALDDPRIWDHPALSAEHREWAKNPDNIQRLLKDLLVDNEGSLDGLVDGFDTFASVARMASARPYAWTPEAVKSAQMEGALAEHLQKYPLTLSGTGRTPTLYAWDVPDKAIPEMVQWDKLISEQPKNVARVLRNLDEGWASGSSPAMGPADVDVLEMIHNYPDQYTAGEALRALEGPYGDDAHRLAKALRDGGVPGNKYWDGYSRRSKAGHHNLVIYDTDLPKLRGSINVEKSPSIKKRVWD